MRVVTITSPGLKSNAESASEKATVAFSTIATLRAFAPMSCPTASYAASTTTGFVFLRYLAMTSSEKVLSVLKRCTPSVIARTTLAITEATLTRRAAAENGATQFGQYLSQREASVV